MEILSKKGFKVPKLIIFLALMSLSLMGGDCAKILENTGTVPSEMVGNWKLVLQTGALQDICPEETINFQATGVAILTCPNSTAVERNFTVQNSIVTYAQSSVQYKVEFSNNNNTLELYGINVSRNLFYNKIITDNIPESSEVQSESNNSSEMGGVK